MLVVSLILDLTLIHSGGAVGIMHVVGTAIAVLTYLKLLPLPAADAATATLWRYPHMPIALPTSRTRLRYMLPVLAAMLLAGCSSVTSVTKTASAATQGTYVALGDSYTAGTGIPDQVGSPPGCERSDHNYPSLLARRLKLTARAIHDVSCSGATISDITTSQITGSGANVPQFDALTSDTTLVTLGIGGNDLDFTGVLTRCVELDAPVTLISVIRHNSADLAPCRTYYTVGGDQIHEKLQVAGPRLEDALTRIHQLAPHARVYVVGYPALLPPGGTSCAEKLGLTAGDMDFLNTQELELNAMLQQDANTAGDTYVDTYTPSVGHDACSDPATRWIEPIITDGSAAPLHPNVSGEQHIAAAVENAMSNR